MTINSQAMAMTIVKLYMTINSQAMAVTIVKIYHILTMVYLDYSQDMPVLSHIPTMHSEDMA